MNILKKILPIAVIIIAALQSCKKDEHQIMLVGGTAPVLAASSTNTLILNKADKDNTAIVLSWTNPEYRFTTGISSQNVFYFLQVDAAGADFSSSKLQEKSIPNDLSIALTVKDLNTFLTKMELQSGVSHDIEMRIKSTLDGGGAGLFSNSIRITVTPYLDFAVEPPGTAANNYNDGALWIIGDATAAGWNNPMAAPYTTTNQFRRVDALHYVLDSINFNAGGYYKLIQEQGNWSTQYHAKDGTAALEGELEKKDADPAFPSPGAGLYKIEINFQTGKYKLTKL